MKNTLSLSHAPLADDLLKLSLSLVRLSAEVRVIERITHTPAIKPLADTIIYGRVNHRAEPLASRPLPGIHEFYRWTNKFGDKLDALHNPRLPTDICYECKLTRDHPVHEPHSADVSLEAQLLRTSRQYYGMKKRYEAGERINFNVYDAVKNKLTRLREVLGEI